MDRASADSAHVAAMSLRRKKAIGYALIDLVPDDPRSDQGPPPELSPARGDEAFVVLNFEGYIA